MLTLGPEYCIIKKGEHGAMAFGPKGFFAAVPAYPVERVVDPTGAGDSFAGGVVGHIARTGDTRPGSIIAALRQGTVMGSFNVSDFSCNRFKRLTPRELTARLAEFARMTGAR
jgi:sugar/nucleoside kinase (ribokinase family)